MSSVKSFLKGLVYGEPESPPIITVQTGAALLVVYALLYFLPFYLSSWTRPSATLSRDAPSVIRARITSVTFSCLACCATTYLILVRDPRAGVQDALHLMGLWPANVVASVRVLALTMLLFLGPLFDYFIVDNGWKDWLRGEPLKELWGEWTVWRNLVAGPITEEVLYRAASVPLMLVARATITQTIFLSPVIFGLSHFHHFYEFRITHPEVPMIAAVARSIFQLAYTTLFGAYATFLYVRTGSLLGVCLVHAFCNAMGLPRLWGLVHRDGAAASATKEGAAQQTGSVAWSIPYYFFLLLGVLLFYRGFWSLSESELALIPTDAFFKVAEKKTFW